MLTVKIEDVWIGTQRFSKESTSQFIFVLKPLARLAENGFTIKPRVCRNNQSAKMAKLEQVPRSQQNNNNPVT